MFDSGILKICELTNIAQPGNMPKEALRTVATAYYHEQRVGVTRAYNAMSVNQRIDMLVLCFNCEIPYHATYAVTENGDQYVISMKQKQGDDVLLTLTRLEDFLDVDDTE